MRAYQIKDLPSPLKEIASYEPTVLFTMSEYNNVIKRVVAILRTICINDQTFTVKYDAYTRKSSKQLILCNHPNNVQACLCNLTMTSGSFEINSENYYEMIREHLSELQPKPRKFYYTFIEIFNDQVYIPINVMQPLELKTDEQRIATIPQMHNHQRSTKKIMLDLAKLTPEQAKDFNPQLIKDVIAAQNKQTTKQEN